MADKKHELSTLYARTMLRAAGLRSTTCRVGVLQHLSTATSPLSHADVADRLVPEGFDKSTIYRCLVELAEAGLANRLDLGDHVWRFEARRGDDHHADEHPHFMCLDCGKVACLPEVTVQISPSKGRKVAAVGNVTEVLLKGHCAACR
jgi:Fur family ferric uptake transcriptional regulator